LDGRHQYIIFYLAFTGIFLSISAAFPVELISGISQEDIDSLQNSAVFPDEPTLLDYLVFPFIAGFGFIQKLFVLSSVSSEFQFVSFILGLLTVGLILTVYSLLRNG